MFNWIINQYTTHNKDAPDNNYKRNIKKQQYITKQNMSIGFSTAQQANPGPHPEQEQKKHSKLSKYTPDHIQNPCDMVLCS